MNAANHVTKSPPLQIYPKQTIFQMLMQAILLIINVLLNFSTFFRAIRRCVSMKTKLKQEKVAE